MKLRCLALALALATPAHAETPPDLSWLAGYWLSCDNNREVSETWSDIRGGVMVGYAFTLRKGKPSWEQNRMAAASSGEGVSFYAHPSGQVPAEFRYMPSKSRAQYAVFENPAHDFPQRVIYSRDGDRLTGRIEGVIDGKSQAADWHFTAASFNQRCPS